MFVVKVTKAPHFIQIVGPYDLESDAYDYAEMTSALDHEKLATVIELTPAVYVQD